jgi:hypothetical protein
LAIQYPVKEDTKMSENILLISPTVLKERTPVHGNVDDKLIYPEIKYAQDAFIKPILGSALFAKLQTLITGTSPNNISDPGNADYKVLMDSYIIDALVYYTLMGLVTSASYQMWNKGVVRKLGDNTELPSMSELVDLSNGHRNKAEHYAKAMRRYLLQYANTKYPEYLNPGNTIDTIWPDQNEFSNPIYLGSRYGDFGDYNCWVPITPYKP